MPEIFTGIFLLGIKILQPETGFQKQGKIDKRKDKSFSLDKHLISILMG